jgi:regulator of protease activity HflC (stomatin/prohibitin superfamily)
LIKDVHPPESIVSSMHQQVSAERKKRADVLESEGKRLAAVNVAQGIRESVILESEAARMKIINCAEGKIIFNTVGEAEGMRIRAEASALMITKVAESIKEQGVHGKDAIALTIAEQYISAFGELAKEGTTVVILWLI